MKSKLYRTLLLCVSSALVAGAAFAQSDQSTQPGGTSTQPGSPTGSPSGRQAMMRGQAIRCTKIIGSQVKSSTGETLGTIEDLIVNPQSGRTEFAVLSLTGPTGTTPTGAGEKLTPIPWKLLSLSSPPQPGAGGAEQPFTFTANVDQAKLASAPSFDKNQWPDISRSEWSHRIFSYYGLSQEGGPSGGTGSSTEKGSGAGGLQPKSGTSQ